MDAVSAARKMGFEAPSVNRRERAILAVFLNWQKTAADYIIQRVI